MLRAVSSLMFSKYINGGVSFQQKKLVSILYVNSDKLSENNPPINPYMDFEEGLRNVDALKENIAHRRMSIDVDNILKKYSQYLDGLKRVDKVRVDQEHITNEVKKLKEPDPAIDILKEKGRQLKNEIKQIKMQYSKITDGFIQDFLNLPNDLHPACPCMDKEEIIYENNIQRIKDAAPHLRRTDLIKFLNNTCYYLMDEAAEFEINSTHALVNHFTDYPGFIQTANPDFVRRVLLEANATPEDSYHLVMEQDLPNKFNNSFLAGGASFESFLGAVAKLRVYPSALPLRYVASGRIYKRTSSLSETHMEANLFTAMQSHAVSTFAAFSTAAEADQHMKDIINITVAFYKELGVHFRVVYLLAAKLTPSERLRAIIEIYSPAQKRYICVGYVSNYGDYVSKRLLFVISKKKDFSFPYLVGGPVLFSSRLIGTLIENNISLENVRLLGAIDHNLTFEDAFVEMKLD